MIEKIQYFLERNGFKKLSATYSGINIYFTIENGYVNAVLVGDMEGIEVLDPQDYEQLVKKTQWRFLDGGFIDVHMLSVIITDDLDRARALCEKELFAWFIDVRTKELIIDPDKAEDFYGMRGQIATWAKQEYNPSLRSSLHDMVYDVNGKPYYKSVLDRSFVNHLFFIINVLVFTTCILTGNILYELGCSEYSHIFEQGQWYRLITSMFLHADMTHLTGNMLILYIVGDMVERAMGHGKYLVLYFLSGLVGNFTSLYLSHAAGQQISSIGASGAIFGVVGAMLWIAVRNHGKYDVLDVRKILFLIGYSIFSGVTATNVDNAAHIGGLFGGLILAILLYRLNTEKKRRK